MATNRQSDGSMEAGSFLSLALYNTDLDRFQFGAKRSEIMAEAPASGEWRLNQRSSSFSLDDPLHQACLRT